MLQKMDVNGSINRSWAVLDSVSNYSNESVFSATTAEILPVKIIKFVLYAVVFIVGLGGNSIVIWIMIKKKKARNFHNLLLCNLAAADIALLSINLPFRLAYQENDYVWPFGRLLCKIIPMFTYLFLTASSLTLVAISYERHRKISSLTAKSEPAGLCSKLLIVLLWLISCITTIPLNISLDVLERKNGKLVCTDVWPSATVEEAYFLFLFAIQFLLPTVVMVVVYIRVGLIIRSTRYKMNAFGLANVTRKHHKTVRMICAIVIVYILLTLPYHITWQLSRFGIKNAWAKKFSVLFLTATGASHPIIYGALHQEFAAGFMAFLRCSKKARTEFFRLSVRFKPMRLHTPNVQTSHRETSINEYSSSVELVQKISVV